MIEGRHALVTGGGTGVGRAIALALAEAGAAVTICGRREAPLAQAAGEHTRIAALVADVTDEARASLAATNPQHRFIQPQEVAAAVLWLCSDAARSVTGQALSISGGETW